MNIKWLSSSIKGLNTKIISYFIAFAFVPLLIFSILGYYLNKDMITRMNSGNLRAVNQYYANKLINSLELKRLILADYYHSCNDKGENNFYACIQEKFELEEYIVRVELLNADQGKSKVLYKKKTINDTSKYPKIKIPVDEKHFLHCSLDPDQIFALIKSEVAEINHEIIFPDINYKLTQNHYTHFPDLQELLKAYHKRNSSLALETFVNNETVISTFTLIPGVKWYLVSNINVNDFYLELKSFRNKIILANLLFAAILIILAFFYSNRITQPIHKLVGAVQRIRKGNLDHAIHLKTGDEVQILADEFELMRQKLSESYQNFEKKIEDRTAELRKAQSQIIHQEKMASLGLMAAGIAHEIGNPLTSISSMAQMIKRKTHEKNITEFSNSILNNIERISKIVRELVDFSRPSAYTEAMSNVNEIINSAVGIVKYDRRSKHMKFNLSLDKNIPETLCVADQLLQVFINILLNAVDASEGFHDEINVSSAYKNRKIRIEISDRGSGIAKDKLNKIFEPFYTTKGVGKGTGLGLTVSYGIIKKLQGDITVESEAGKGSNFKIVIPVIKGES